MQEIKKRRILLASVLKPVDEPRMFERMGQSLAAHGYEVFITGFPLTDTKSCEGIHFLPHQRFNRIGIARVRVRFEILGKAFSIKPDIFIISTHELIGVALIYWLMTGRKIVYDVQENYWRNILYTNAWPKLIRPVIAFFVRLKEWITSPLFSKFLLAEKCYASELSFMKKRSVVIENKCRVPTGFQRKPVTDCVQLIFTGTIADSTGIFETIDIAKKLHQTDARIKLNIVGQCSQTKTLQRIENEISQNDFITLIGGKGFVSHEKIFEAISSAHFGVVFYPSSPHTQNKIPSKLYEYLACGLPILLQNHKLWTEICKPYEAVITLDLPQLSIDAVLRQMDENRFYSQCADEANWATEEPQLLQAMSSV